MSDIPDDIPEVYNIENIEQIRAIADELRLRVGEALAAQPMTVTQLGALLGEAPAKIHYHVRELERVGLVKLVATREKGGILEKYYRAVAKTVSVPPSILQHASPDETIGAANQYLQMIAQGFLRTLGEAVRLKRFGGPDAPELGVGATQVWMTAEELKQVQHHMQDLLQPYLVRRGMPDEHEITVAQVVFQVLAAAAGGGDAQAGEDHIAAQATAAGTDALGSGTRPRVRHRVTFGVTTIDRDDLESVVARGEQLDISTYGYCIVANDVAPELVERAIARFHLVGGMSASPAVRVVLQRKEVPPKD